MSDHYCIEKIAYGKIAEERQEAARYWLAVKAEQARRDTGQGATSLLAGASRVVGHLLSVAGLMLAHGLRVR